MNLWSLITDGTALRYSSMRTRFSLVSRYGRCMVWMITLINLSPSTMHEVAAECEPAGFRVVNELLKVILDYSHPLQHNTFFDSIFNKFQQLTSRPQKIRKNYNKQFYSGPYVCLKNNIIFTTQIFTSHYG